MAIPQLDLRAVTQRYTRLDDTESTAVYRYQSGSFSTDIAVDEHDLLLD